MRATGDLGGVPVFCSWSGGKDSALALHEAVLAGAAPRLLVAMMIEGGGRSRSHGLPGAAEGAGGIASGSRASASVLASMPACRSGSATGGE